jgi:hypothetical protein
MPAKTTTSFTASSFLRMVTASVIHGVDGVESVIMARTASSVTALLMTPSNNLRASLRVKRA